MPIETAHSLIANFDGHEIIAQFDGVYSCSIIVDGNVIAKKKRFY